MAAATMLWLAGLVGGPMGFDSLPPLAPLAPPVTLVVPAARLATIRPLEPVSRPGAAPIQRVASVLSLMWVPPLAPAPGTTSAAHRGAPS